MSYDLGDLEYEVVSKAITKDIERAYNHTKTILQFRLSALFQLNIQISSQAHGN
jgi:hypothetical protein